MATATIDPRTAGVAAVALLVALGVLVGPATAGNHSGSDERGADDNSSFSVSTYGHVAGAGGEGSMECTGDPLGAHGCDKGGELDAGPLSVDYDGYNYGDPPGRTGGGGDAFTVEGGDQEATVGFDCDLGPTPESSDCAVTFVP